MHFKDCWIAMINSNTIIFLLIFFFDVNCMKIKRYRYFNYFNFLLLKTFLNKYYVLWTPQRSR